jgi:hypothetical protein
MIDRLKTHIEHHIEHLCRVHACCRLHSISITCSCTMDRSILYSSLFIMLLEFLHIDKQSIDIQLDYWLKRWILLDRLMQLWFFCMKASDYLSSLLQETGHVLTYSSSWMRRVNYPSDEWLHSKLYESCRSLQGFCID